MKKKQAQVSVEYVFVIAFVLMMIIPLTLIFYNQISNTNNQVALYQLDKIAKKIVDSSESVYYLGEMSKTRIKFYMPQGVEQAIIGNNEIIFKVKTNRGQTDITHSTLVNLSGNISVTPGIHYVVIESKGNYVLVGEIDIKLCGQTDVGECSYGTQKRIRNSEGQWIPDGACINAVYPATEICDGKDNDCDGLTDEDDICSMCATPGEEETISCYEGQEGTEGVGLCSAGTKTRTCDSEGQWGLYGECIGAVYPATEICDDKDNDCDNITDEEGVCWICIPGEEETISCYEGQEGTEGVGLCSAGIRIRICNSEGQWVPNEECTGAVYPVNEIPDGLDNNCDGLIDVTSYWKFDEGSGTIAIDSVGGDNGTIHGASWIAGVNGSALSFNGNSDYIEILDSDNLDLANEFTIGMWVYPKVWLNNVKGFIFYKEQAYELNLFYKISTWYLEGNVRGLSPDSIKIDGASFVPDVWSYITLTFDGSELKLYQDGTLKQTTPTSGDVNINNNNLYIGSNQPNSDYFNGAIDEVTIWNKALTITEIQELCN